MKMMRNGRVSWNDNVLGKRDFWRRQKIQNLEQKLSEAVRLLLEASEAPEV